MLTNKKFIKFAKDNLVVLIVHNERGHDAVEEKGYDGKTVPMCPLYPGMTCRDHCDAAVDVDAPRDENITKVPFIELCPNSWLVPPQGEPVQISEEDQFVAKKVQGEIEKMRKSLGSTLEAKVYREIVNAFAFFESAVEDEAYEKAVRALAGVETLAKKPHKALMALVEQRLEELEDELRWQFEDAIEVGAKDDTPMSERVATVKSYVKALDVAVYGKHAPDYLRRAAAALNF